MCVCPCAYSECYSEDSEDEDDVEETEAQYTAQLATSSINVSCHK